MNRTEKRRMKSKLALIVFGLIYANKVIFTQSANNNKSIGLHSKLKFKQTTIGGLNRSWYNAKCPPSDHSIKCVMYREKLKKLYVRIRKRSEEVLHSKMRDKREVFDNKMNQQNVAVGPQTTESTSQSLLKAKRATAIKRVRIIDDRKKMIIRKFRSRWRFIQGRYRTLPVCNSTEAPDATGPGVSKFVSSTTVTTTTTTVRPEPFKKIIPISSGQKDALVRAHNEVRREVFPPATDMRQITWDEELAWHAGRYTGECSYQERDAFVRLNSGLRLKTIERHSALDAEIGFNWFAWKGITGLPSDFVKQIIEAWMVEKMYYHFYTRECDSICRHFLQVIWGKTYKLGCAASCCGLYNINGIIWYDATLILCAYAPRGNVLRYHNEVAPSLPYPTPPLTLFPYTYGDTCDHCGGNGQKVPEEDPRVSYLRNKYAKQSKTNSPDRCVNKLCVNSNRDKSIPFTPPDAPTTTTFSWTTTINPLTTTLGILECFEDDFESDDDYDSAATHSAYFSFNNFYAKSAVLFILSRYFQSLVIDPL